MGRYQRLLLPLLTILIALTLAVPAMAAEQVFKAKLAAGSGIDSDASGLAILTLEADGGTLNYSLSVFGISNVTQAHIHQGGPTENGPIVLWLYPSAPPAALIPGVFNGVLMEGSATAANFVGPLAGMPMGALLDLIEANDAYVNVHTSAHPGGEIRGQVAHLAWPDIDQALLDTYGLELADLAEVSDGFIDGTWGPGLDMSRGQFAKVALEAFDLPTATPATPTFVDVPPTHPFFPWIEGAKAAGLVNGITPTMFGPGLDVLREQGAAIIARRLAAVLGLNVETIFTGAEINQILGAFSDAAAVSGGLRQEIAFAVHFEVMLGSAGKLNPRVELKRIQGAALLTRAARGNFALPGDAVFPEGVAFDEESGFYFVGSTNGGTIFRGRLIDPEAEVFLPGGEDGRNVAVGMKVDAEGRLIIAGGPTGTVWVYDTVDGELIARFSNGLGEGETFLNDLVVAPNGDVFVTDSISPTLWRIPAEEMLPSTELQPLEDWLDFTGSPIEFQEGFNLNGIVVTPDGQHLLTVQTNTGNLFRITIATQAMVQVDLDGVLLDGGDGMLLEGTELVVVGNGRVRIVDLEADFAAGELVETIVEPSFHFPTTAAFADGLLLVVNSQFDRQGGTPDLPFTVSFLRP